MRAGSLIFLILCFALCFALFFQRNLAYTKKSSFEASLEKTPWLGVEIWQQKKQKLLELLKEDPFAKKTSLKLNTHKLLNKSQKSLIPPIELRLPKTLIRRKLVWLNFSSDLSAFMALRKLKEKRQKFKVQRALASGDQNKEFKLLLNSKGNYYYFSRKNLRKVARKKYALVIAEINSSSQEKSKSIFLTIFVDRNKDQLVGTDEFELIELKVSSKDV